MKKIKTFTLPETRFLSNFYPHKKDGSKYPHSVSVKLDDVVYDCTETAYQAAKTTNKEERQMIRVMSPYHAKAYWIGYEDKIRPDWEQIKDDVMRDLVTQKFKNNKELKQMLLNTGVAILEEGNDWDDTYWGISNGRGDNRLGKILMELRSKLQKSSKKGQAAE